MSSAAVLRIASKISGALLRERSRLRADLQQCEEEKGRQAEVRVCVLGGGGKEGVYACAHMK